MSRKYCKRCKRKIIALTMHLFESKKGDRWVCSYCAQDEKEMIHDEGWEYLFDRDEQYLRCSLCGEPEFIPED